MKRDTLVPRAVTALLIACLLHMIIAPPLALAQNVDCPYDKDNPSLDNARISFKSLNYRCAEQEIHDLLMLEDISIEDKADAHVLLAAVYYAMLKNDTEKRNRVIEQFKAAFEAYRDWRGELDISSTEFIEMMNEAQVMVDQEAQEQPAVVEEPAPEPEAEEPVEEVEAVKPAEVESDDDEAAPAAYVSEGKSKPWYSKWWAIALGVGLVAGAVVVASGGGGDDGDGGGVVVDTLASFPDPPSK
jgi:hypothetical protein